MDDPNIPEENIKILRRFLTAYDVSDARRTIFLQKIRPLLAEFKPIESALTERDHINEFFAGLRQRYSPATYATYINVVKRFLTWLNDGVRPASLLDIKPTKASKTKRNLKPEDMISWDEGLLLSDALCNIQLSAAVQTQLDCGFRPSEFIDLSFQDVEVMTGLAVFHVRDGKTGSRSVVAHRCVPALLKWLDAHPTKRPNDPLWIFEGSIRKDGNHLRVNRYAYPAIAKRIKLGGRKIGLDKPLDFYNLRHSSCVLDKMDNLPVDLAAERHGHSVKHFTGTYGRLSVKDVMRRFHSHYGTDSAEPEQKLTHQVCPVCQTLNDNRQNWCSSCGSPLNTAGALETAQKSGHLNREGKNTAPSEIEQLKAELAASREREQKFMKEQMELLQQMQHIQSAMGGNFNPHG
ncbi:tyrosine-type recombinase/integrase [Pontiellaceae bacterium B12227]|nr:tyrosine-type recombinase/integrase [Pontiellaceae bacterium B12227]